MGPRPGLRRLALHAVVVAFADLKLAGVQRQCVGLVAQALGCGRGFFEHCGVLLCDLVQLIGCGGDFRQAGRLFTGCFGQCAHGFVDGADMFVDLVQRRAGVARQSNARFYLTVGIADEVCNLASRIR